MIRKLFILVAIAMGLIMAAYGIGAAYTLKTYTNRSDGYSIEYPDTWSLEEGKDGIFIKSPRESAGDDITENISIATENTGKEFSLDDYYRASVENMKLSVTDYNEISVTEIMIAGVKAKRILCTYGVDSSKFKSLVFLFVKGETAYIVVCTAVPSSIGRFETTFDEIAKSFRFENLSGKGNLVGNWKGIDKSGETGYISFDSEGYAFFVINGGIWGGKEFTLANGKKAKMKYETDFQATPNIVDFVILLKDTNQEIGRLKGIFIFLNKDRIKLRFSFEQTSDRPKDFMPEDNPDTMVLERTKEQLTGI